MDTLCELQVIGGQVKWTIINTKGRFSSKESDTVYIVGLEKSYFQRNKQLIQTSRPVEASNWQRPSDVNRRKGEDIIFCKDNARQKFLELSFYSFAIFTKYSSFGWPYSDIYRICIIIFFFLEDWKIPRVVLTWLNYDITRKKRENNETNFIVQ